MNDEMNTPQSDDQADMSTSTEEGTTPEVTAEMPETEETSAEEGTEGTNTEETPATE